MVNFLSEVPTGATGLAIALVAALVLLGRLLAPKIGPSEPPILKPRIPFVGHIIGMMREKNSFYQRL
jgi:hypothetical protein